MYILQIQTPNSNKEYVSNSLDRVFDTFSKLPNPKVLVIKSVEDLPYDDSEQIPY